MRLQINRHCKWYCTLTSKRRTRYSTKKEIKNQDKCLCTCDLRHEHFFTLHYSNYNNILCRIIKFVMHSSYRNKANHICARVNSENCEREKNLSPTRGSDFPSKYLNGPRPHLVEGLVLSRLLTKDVVSRSLVTASSLLQLEATKHFFRSTPYVPHLPYVSLRA